MCLPAFVSRSDQKNEKIEDEIEADVRRRTKGKHVEIASITMEGTSYAPEIANAIQAKLVGEQEAARQKALVEADAKRKKVEIEVQSEQAKQGGGHSTPEEGRTCPG